MALAATSIAPTAIAATATWTGNTSTDWLTETNWSTNLVPGTGITDQANIDTVGSTAPVIDSTVVTVGSFSVANTDAGSLLIKNGGVLRVVGANSSIGAFDSGKTGIVTIMGDGSQLDLTRGLFIGSNLSTGFLNIVDGGLLTSSASITIASGTDSTGSLLVSGPGSTMTLTGYAANFLVGSRGAGLMVVENGGVVNAGGNVNRIGYTPNLGDGTVLVTGVGSAWNNANLFYIGDFAKGALVVSDGGTVTSGVSEIGKNANGNGTVTVTGSNSAWINRDLMTVGLAGTGTMNVLNGGIVSNSDSFVGRNTNSHGSVMVSGVNALWNNSGELNVANAGTGIVTVAEEGHIVATSIKLAALPSSTGTVNIGNGGQAGTLTADTITGGAGTATVNFNHTDTVDFTPSLTGRLTVNQTNRGTTRLLAANDYTGTTTISTGTLQAATTGAFSAMSDYIVEADGQMELAGSSQTLASLNNAGTVSFNGTPGTVLKVAGDYIGNNGMLAFNTILNDDASVTDKFVIEGDSAGTTRVRVTNIGGRDAATLNGIELVQVNGSSDGIFIKSGRIVAGAYDYSLVRGTGTNTGNWYLSSTLAPTYPPSTEPGVMILRPEAGAYSANLTAANTMFITRLHDRQGEASSNTVTSLPKTSSMWLRNEGGQNRSRDESNQLDTRSNRYVMQLGGNVAQWSTNDRNRLDIGIMAGYARSSNRTESRLTGYDAKSSVNGYSAGIYGTWYADAVDNTGLYVDSWAQYSWFDNIINGHDLAKETYKSKGFTASLESGYTFKIGQSTTKNTAYFIQPQAQVVWMGVTADDHKEANGTRVSGIGDGNIQTRLGGKAFLRSYTEDKSRFIQLFMETNWIHNTKEFGTTLDTVTVTRGGDTDIAEIKLGLEGQISKQLNIWSSIGHQIGDKNYSDTTGMLGIKYTF